MRPQLWTPPWPIRRPPPAAAATSCANWLDVANWQGALSPEWFREWATLGYGGLIVQAVAGLDGRSFTRHQLGLAQEMGWEIAGYAWVHAGQAHDSRGFRNRLALFDGFPLDFLAVDVEDLQLRPEDVEASLELGDDYLGEQTWVYSSRGVFARLGWLHLERWGDRRLWDANYDGVPDVDQGFHPYGGWTRCEMKQFTDGAQPIFTGGVDQNVRRMT